MRIFDREAFAKPLRGLRAEPGVLHALVTTPDGLLLAGAESPGETNELWAAVSAVLGKLGGTLLSDASGEALETAVFGSTKYQLVVKPVSLGFVLAVTEPTAEAERICGCVAAAAREVEDVAAELIGRPPERKSHV